MKAFPYFSNIRFWIVVLFIIRLIGITNPPLEVEHNWRQTTVTMVARNFLEVDNNIFYPRVDFAGDKTGITGMEFPLLNYMIYGVAQSWSVTMACSHIMRTTNGIIITLPSDFLVLQS